MAQILHLKNKKLYMYCLKIKKKDNNSLNIILEGNLNSATLLQKELKNIFEDKSIEGNKLIINLRDVETISTECYKMFQKLKKKYPIIIQGHSLFIGTKLKKYNLL